MAIKQQNIYGKWNRRRNSNEATLAAENDNGKIVLALSLSPSRLGVRQGGPPWHGNGWCLGRVVTASPLNRQCPRDPLV